MWIHFKDDHLLWTQRTIWKNVSTLSVRRTLPKVHLRPSLWFGHLAFSGSNYSCIMSISKWIYGLYGFWFHFVVDLDVGFDQTRWEITPMITTTGAKSDYFLEFCQFTSHAVELTAHTDGWTVNDSVYLVAFGCVSYFSDQIANSRSRSNTWETIKLILSIFPFCRDRLTAHITQAVRGD